jgi:hypothetical protein
LISGFWVTASEERPFLENCEAISSMSPSHSRIYTDNLNRYSNTLLVWFNNRISIRKAAIAQVEVHRRAAIPLAITIQSDITTFMENEQSQVAHKFSVNGAG